MRTHTRFLDAAHARGLTGAELAKRLGWYRSNLSAMDAGRRSVSIRALTRAARLLGCSPADLLEVQWTPQRPLFQQAVVNRRLLERDTSVPDGIERGWVHRAQLAWRRHYHAAREGPA